MAGSPQSTLCEVGSWLRCSNGSSQASSNVPSQVSSPPTTPMDQKQDAWDLLYAAAGQVVKMRMNGQGLKSHCRGLLASPRKPFPAPVSTPVKPPSPNYYYDEALNHLQMQHNQVRLPATHLGLEKKRSSVCMEKSNLTFRALVFSVSAFEAAAAVKAASVCILGKTSESIPCYAGTAAAIAE